MEGMRAMAGIFGKKQESGKKPGKIYAAGIYARLSVDSGERKNESIDTQVEIARDFIGRQADMEVYGIYTDTGRTGTNFKREGFERMMRDVRARRIDCIVVKDLSRFGRNHIETGNYMEKIFPFMGVRFIAVTDHYDSMDISGQNEMMSVNLKNLVNEMYARDIAAKVKAGKRAKWEQGSYTGGIPPYGYRAEWIDGKKCLLIEKGTSDIVKKIYDLFLSGGSRKEIVAWLYENKVARPAEYRKTGQVFCTDGQELFQWSGATVRLILTNPVYMGRLIQGYTCGKDYGMRERHDIDARAWSVREHTHEAIISEELFWKAAEKFEEASVYCNKNGFSKTVPVEEDVFADVLYCGECGSKMRRITAVKELGSKNRVRTYSYKCPRSGRIDSMKCPGMNITMEMLVEIMRKTLRQEFILSGIRPKNLEEMNGRITEEQKEKWSGQLAVMEEKLEKITRAGSEQYLKYRMGKMDEVGFKRAKEENDKKADNLRARSRAIVEKLRKIDSETAGQDRFWRALIKGSGKGELTAEFVRTLFARVEVYPGHRIKIVFAFRQSGLLSGEGG